MATILRGATRRDVLPLLDAAEHLLLIGAIPQAALVAHLALEQALRDVAEAGALSIARRLEAVEQGESISLRDGYQLIGKVRAQINTLRRS